MTAAFTPPPDAVTISANAAAHHHGDPLTPRRTQTSSHGSAAYPSSVTDVRALKTTTYGFKQEQQARDGVRDAARAAGELVHQLDRAPGGEREDQAQPQALHEPRRKAQRVSEREERPDREQVAAVLTALDMAQVAGRRPRARHVGEEADRVDVEVDLRVRRGQPGALDEGEQERQGSEPPHDGSVPVARPHDGAEDTVPAHMRRRLPLLAAIALLALPTLVAFARGGYFDAARLRAGIAACVLAAVAAAVAPRPFPSTVAGRVAIGGLAALFGWSLLSLTWAPLAGPAVDDVERLALYLAALVAAAALLTGRAAPWTEPALLAGIAATALYGLSERLLPGVFELTRSLAAGDRLAQPLTYWNGQGALAAIGLALAAGIVARSGAAARGRRLATPPRAAGRRERGRAAIGLSARRRGGAPWSLCSGSTCTSRSRAARWARRPSACSCCWR